MDKLNSADFISKLSDEDLIEKAQERELTVLEAELLKRFTIAHNVVVGMKEFTQEKLDGFNRARQDHPKTESRN